MAKAKAVLGMLPANNLEDAPFSVEEDMNRRLEGFEAGWVDAGGGSDANRIAQAGTPVVDGVAPAGGCFHSEREYLRVDTIENRVRMLSRFLPLL